MVSGCVGKGSGREEVQQVCRRDYRSLLYLWLRLIVVWVLVIEPEQLAPVLALAPKRGRGELVVGWAWLKLVAEVVAPYWIAVLGVQCLGWEIVAMQSGLECWAETLEGFGGLELFVVREALKF